MKKKYQAPTKEFFRLPNNIFDLRLTPIQFTIYAYLVSRSGSKGYCWPTHETIVRDTGIGKTSVQEALKILKKRKIIAVSKHRKPYGFSNNEYTLLNARTLLRRLHSGHLCPCHHLGTKRSRSDHGKYPEYVNSASYPIKKP